MKDWVKVALDCGLLNYVDHDNQNYFIDGYADVATVRQFVHDLTAELVAENIKMKSELEGIHSGYHGACYACEPVALENKRLLQAEKALLRQLRWENDCVDANGAIDCPNPENCACKAETRAMIALEGIGNE